MQYTLFSSFSFIDESISSFNIDRNAVKVFVPPVGAEIKVFFLVWTSMMPNFCGSEKESNFLKNHFDTTGFKIFFIVLSLSGSFFLRIILYSIQYGLINIREVLEYCEKLKNLFNLPEFS